MPTSKDTSPAAGKAAFTCPHCGVYAQQLWESRFRKLASQAGTATMTVDERLRVSSCHACYRMGFWVDGRLVAPEAAPVARPHPLLPPACTTDFEEARTVVTRSPRSAAAMLRLCIARLLAVLGARGDDADAKVADLVARGLPVRVQEALAAVRVVGRNRLPPGVLDAQDDYAAASAMFSIVSIIVERMIAEEHALQQLPGGVPAAPGPA